MPDLAGYALEVEAVQHGIPLALRALRVQGSRN